MNKRYLWLSLAIFVLAAHWIVSNAWTPGHPVTGPFSAACYLRGDSTCDAPVYTKDLYLDNPVTDDSGKIQVTFPGPSTLARVWCSTDTGTATIQFDERAEATPNTGGTDVLTDALACDSDTQATTSFANGGIAVRVPMNLDIDAVADAPAKLRIHIEYTVDS